MQLHDEWVVYLLENFTLRLSILLLIHLHDELFSQSFHRINLTCVNFLDLVYFSEGPSPNHHQFVKVFWLVNGRQRPIGAVSLTDRDHHI